MKAATPFTTSKASGLIVSVPEGLKIAIGYINDEYTKGQYLYGSASSLPIADWHEPLPPGNWHFLGLSHELTEQEAQQLIERKIWTGKCSYYGYEDFTGEEKPFAEALPSFNSLLLSLGLDPKENLAILINDKK